MSPLEQPVEILSIDHTWHPGWHPLIKDRCGFALANVAYPLVNGMYTISRLAFAAFPRPVGGTHRRTRCQCCGGTKTIWTAGADDYYSKLLGGDLVCLPCVIVGDHVGVTRWGRP